MEKVMTFIMLCVIAAGIAADKLFPPDNNLVVKPNYGVMFEKVMLLDTTSDFWYDTVIVPMPTVQNVRAENINTCEDLLKVNLNETMWDD